MGLNMRNFADILASRQGGVRLDPGRSITRDLTGEEVERIFGSEPAAYAAHGLIITLRKIGKDRYRMTIKRES